MTQQPYPPPQQPAKKKMSCGMMALIAVGASVAILPIFAALAIYGVRRYLAASKTSEAKNFVGAIARAGEAAYERRSATAGAGAGAMCGSAPSIPAIVPPGKKYQSAAGEWETGDDANGWKCLRFALSLPQYYQLSYNKDAGFKGPVPGGAANAFEAAAAGDLDADGKHSLFARHGMISATGDFRLSSQIYIENELE